MESDVAEGIYSSFMAICGIVLIPVLVWWLRQRAAHKTKLFGYLLILFFAQGSLELLGRINVTLLRYAFELPLILCYLICYFRTRRKKLYGGRTLLLPFIATAVVSGIQTGPVMTGLFLLYVLEIFMMLFFFRNSFNWRETQLIHKLFLFLASAQIAAALIKYVSVGVMEPYIGTMSSHAGGITTIFALITFCICLEMFMCTKKKWILLLALGFILFGFIGDKRALAFFFPVFYILTVLFHTLLNRADMFSVRMMGAGIILAPLLFVGACILSPSLNPEEKVGGSFDMEYVINFSDKYNSGNDAYDDVGRSNALPIILARLSGDNLYHKAFGYGAGTLVSSRFNEFDNTDRTNMERFGVGYSKNIGLVYMLIQVGFVGTILYFGFFIWILIDLCVRLGRLKHMLNSREKGWVISAVLSLFCVIVVSIFYNSTAFYLNPCSILFIWLVSYSYKLLDKAMVLRNEQYFIHFQKAAQEGSNV